MYIHTLVLALFDQFAPKRGLSCIALVYNISHDISFVRLFCSVASMQMLVIAY